MNANFELASIIKVIQSKNKQQKLFLKKLLTNFVQILGIYSIRNGEHNLMENTSSYQKQLRKKYCYFDKDCRQRLSRFSRYKNVLDTPTFTERSTNHTSMEWLNAEAYSEPSRTSKMGRFAKNSSRLSRKLFRKMLHFSCLTGLGIHLQDVS